MRERDRYGKVSWLITLASDEQRGRRTVRGYEQSTTHDLVISLLAVYDLAVEIRCEGLMFRVSCLPDTAHGFNRDERIGATYICESVDCGLRAAMLDYDELARGNGKPGLSARRVTRAVRC